MLDSCNGNCQRAELIERLQRSTEKHNAALETITTLTQQLSAAKADKAKREGTGKLAPLTREWLTYWLENLWTGRGRRPDIEPGSDRWARASRHLGRRIMLAKARGADDPEAEGLADLKAAVDGAKRDQWRMGANDRHKRYVDVKHILKDEQVVEELIAASRDEEPDRPLAEVVPLIPGVENVTLKRLRFENDQQREVIEEMTRQLGALRWVADFATEALAVADAHNAWLEWRVAELEGAPDASDVLRINAQAHGDLFHRAEQAHGRRAA